ncbi:MAG: restriction endonuclease, partial [Chloroflexi bacterium]|nr:restriction endonuclease [Chloroflexota bacterium]
MKFTFTGNWKNFERVIAAFHSAEMAGATINLNEEINGREFDVTIRFQVGFYEYLTLIECKRYSKPVSVEKVEAFVTKSRDANANKALMFSSSGYQSSAIKVAEKYSIDLYTVFEEIRIPEDIQAGGSTEALNVFDVRIVINSKEYSLPQENGRMEYLMRQSFLSDGVGRMTLEDFMQNKLPELNDPSRENEKTKF